MAEDAGRHKRSMARRAFEEHKPVFAIMAVQCIYAGLSLSAKASFTQGLSPMVFLVYRQAIAALLIVPTSIISRRGRIDHLALGCKGFWLVFIGVFIGGTLNQSFYLQGLQRTNSSMAISMINLVPALTFVMAASVGLEKVQLNKRSMAKILGTFICVCGAMSMGLLKGKNLASMENPIITTVLNSFNGKWLIGFLFLLGNIFCWSLWLILQVPICKNYLDPLSLATWTCFLSTFQSATITFFLEPDLKSWRITSVFQLISCLYAAVFGNVIHFYLQSWCISVRGPLFCAMFNPLSTVITTILAHLFLHEELHFISLLGAVAVISGLYIVLWGKAVDLNSNNTGSNQGDVTNSINGCRAECEVDVEQPLLGRKNELT